MCVYVVYLSGVLSLGVLCHATLVGLADTRTATDRGLDNYNHTAGGRTDSL